MSRVPSRKAFWGAVLVQVAVLLGGAAHKYYLRSIGKEVRMRTEPVDPRSLMRGDYVRLRFPMSSVQIPGTIPLAADAKLLKGNRVWVKLDLDSQGLAHPVELSDQAYSEGLQLQGRVEKVRGSNYDLEFGVEAWFVPEGEGRELETRARTGEIVATFSVLPDGRALLVAVEPSVPGE